VPARLKFTVAQVIVLPAVLSVMWETAACWLTAEAVTVS